MAGYLDALVDELRSQRDSAVDTLSDPEMWARKAREARDIVSSPRRAWDTATNVAGRGLAAAAGAPVDTLSTLTKLMRAGAGVAGHELGLTKAEDLPDVEDHGVQRGGSEWIGDQLTKAGLMTGERNPVLETVGGFAAPLAAKGLSGLSRLGSRTQPLAAAAEAPVEAAGPPPEVHTVPTLRETLEANARARDPQAELPGFEQSLAERSGNADQALNAAQARVREEQTPLPHASGSPDAPHRVSTYQPPPREPSLEAEAALRNAWDDANASLFDETRATVNDLQRGRHLEEPIEDTINRERDILSGKHSLAELVTQSPHEVPQDVYTDAITGPDIQAHRVRAKEGIQRWLNQEPDYVPQPDWATQLSTDPRYQRDMPRGVPEPLDTGRSPGASPSWWEKQFPPPDPRESLVRFLREAQNQPSMLTYGVAPPKNVRTIDDFAQHFSDVAGGEPIRVHEDPWYGESDQPKYIEQEKTHGRHELVRDQWGDYKYSEDPKTHEQGDFPMYDAQGNVIKEMAEQEEGPPMKAPAIAQGGEPMKDEYGNLKYPLYKSRGGETVRDERGRAKYEKVENEDYEDPSSGQLILRRGPRDQIDVKGWGSDDNVTTALDAGKSGALLYQTLLAHAAREGIPLGGTSLTQDNQLRLLSNTLANYARMGENPRDVTGTRGGARGRAKDQAEGPELWRALTGETESRLGSRANDIEFTGQGFTARGEPIHPDDIAANVSEYSPSVRQTKVGPKTLMQSAVYRWLEKASPEEAADAARNWSKIGEPLFGLGGTALLSAKLRDDANKGND